MTSPDYCETPAMFRNRPVLFIASLLLVPVFGLGALILLVWYLTAISTRLTIRGNDVHYEQGLLDKSHTDIDLRKVRALFVRQSLWQRFFDVGTIEVHTEGAASAFVLEGMPHPGRVRDLLRTRLDGRSAAR